ncbi:MAG: GlpM family protein [Anaerolineae bacterium]|nr:GlpM family protein [Anaerolineae bacterium]
MSHTAQVLFKASIGALVVVIIQLLTKTRNYYIAALVPLFPAMTILSHYIVGSERTTPELRTMVLFGMFSLIPYLVYLLSFYILVERVRLVTALLGGMLCWLLAAAGLIVVWEKVM